MNAKLCKRLRRSARENAEGLQKHQQRRFYRELKRNARAIVKDARHAA